MPDSAGQSGGEAGEAAAKLPDGSSGDGAQTAAERRGKLDKRLDDSLGEFDETLRKEQERVASERDARAAEGAARDARRTESEGDGDTGALTADAGNRPGELQSDVETKSANKSGNKPADTVSGGTGGGGANAANRPAGVDDDIVARRLRRAAENETDPELKEKLWKEYEQYKRSTS
ncbi:MAG: hypothetical protein IPG25_01880 [Proteobacteria bacterium]|nr:hypothetical protein [Pseudomonadota bacterium]